jgi:hypothetical protein
MISTTANVTTKCKILHNSARLSKITVIFTMLVNAKIHHVMLHSTTDKYQDKSCDVTHYKITQSSNYPSPLNMKMPTHKHAV